MIYDEVQSPKELILFLDENIKYGIIGKNNEVLCNSSSENFQKVGVKYWRLRKAFDIIESGVGQCYDQVEIERDWFSKNNYNFKTVWIWVYQKEFEKIGHSHSYLVYFDKQKWNLFEHSDYFNKGIFTFNSFLEAVKFQADKQIEFANNEKKPINKYEAFIVEFDKPKIGLTMKQYINFVSKSKVIRI